MFRMIENARFRSLLVLLLLLLLPLPAAAESVEECLYLAERAQGHGRPDEAAAWLDRAVAADPNSVTAYTRRAFFALRRGERQQALADFGRAIAVAPQQPGGYLSRGLVRAENGDRTGALADYQAACRLGDDSGCGFARELQAEAVR